MNRKLTLLIIILIISSVFITLQYFGSTNSKNNNSLFQRLSDTELQQIQSPISERFGVNYIDINNVFDFFPISNLVDNNLTTFWTSRMHTSSEGYEWVEIKFNSLISVHNVSFYPRNDFSCFPTSFRIQISNSGLVWDTLYEVHSFSSTNLNDYVFNINKATQRIRIVAYELTSDGSNYYFQLGEISVYTTNSTIELNESNLQVSSTLITSYSPHDWRYLTDGQISTTVDNIWSSGLMYENSREWVQLDLGGAYLINNITLYASINGMGFPIDFQILGSNDTTSWALLSEYTNYSLSKTYASFLFSSVQVRYIRIIASKVSESFVFYDATMRNYFQLNEIQVRYNNGINLAGAPRVSSSSGRNPYFSFNQFNTLLDNSGVKIVRVGFLWTYFEKAKGVLQIDPIATMMINNLISRGYKLIGTLGLGNPLYDGGGPPISDEAVNAFANYARFVVHNYKNYVKFWEIWNEPNFEFWTPVSASAYGKLFLATAQAIHSEDPNAKVLIGATALFDFDFIQSLLEDPQIANQVDVVSIHPYRIWLGEQPEGPSFYIKNGQVVQSARYPTYVDEFLAFRSLVTTYAPKAEIWITELGWQVHDPLPGGVSEYNQAVYLLRSMMLSLQLNISKQVIFSFVDDLRYADYSYGILNYTYTPRLSYELIRNFMNAFQSNVLSTSIFNVNVFANETISVFKSCLIGDNAIYIPVWTNSPGTQNIQLSIDLQGLVNVSSIDLVNLLTGQVSHDVGSISGTTVYFDSLNISDCPILIRIGVQ